MLYPLTPLSHSSIHSYTSASIVPHVHNLCVFQSSLLVKQNLQRAFGANLPDGGALLRNQEAQIKQRMLKLRGYIPSQKELAAALASKDETNEEASRPKVSPNLGHLVGCQ